jgi:uncharacterized protein YciI
VLAGCSPSATQSHPTKAATPDPSAASTSQPASLPKPLYAVSYVAGAGWKAGKPPQEQDLAAHFAYVGSLFKTGKLVVNGLYGDEVRGLYVFGVANEDEVQAIIENDPGVKNGTLAPDGVTPWLVMWDGLGAEEAPGTSYFVLEYGPGRSWVQGRPAMEQNLKSHFGYLTSKQQAGQLIAAGPIPGSDHGRYVIAANSRARADDFVAADPGIQAGVLTPVSIRPWTPVNRQTQAAAAQARGEQ